jgi:LCP family protein required for cell wall assembly
VNETYHGEGSGGQIRATTGASHVTTPTASPPSRAPRARSRRRTILKWTALSLAGIVVIAAVGGFFTYRHLIGNIATSPIKTLHSAPPKAATALKAENFLLIGSDSRAGANEKGTGNGDIAGARSDTTILMHIDGGGGGATLISIPRDSYVQIPSCIGPDGKSHTTPQMNKFNTAFSLGGAKYGPSCEIATVEALTHVPIDHYAVVDFVGFKRMVDALGGVHMCVAHPLSDPHVNEGNGVFHGSGLNLPAGKSVKIDGDQALALMRARYALGDGSDIGRIKRQQQFVGAMIRKATSSGLLIHPFTLLHFLNATTKSITTDGFGLGTMRKLASALQKAGSSSVQILTVPLADPLPPGVPTADVAWDPTKSAELWTAIRDDTTVPGAKPTTTPSPSATPTPTPTKSGPALTVPASSIDVTVLNGSGVSGAAAKAAADLNAQGFHATVGGDASSSTFASTVVKYGPSKVQSSQTVAASIKGSKREADSTLGSTITVIVGANYSGVRAVTIGAGTPTPTATATKKLNVTSASKEGCLQ